MAAIGPYWLSMAWKESCLAPHLNFFDSFTRLLLTWDTG